MGELVGVSLSLECALEMGLVIVKRTKGSSKVDIGVESEDGRVLRERTVRF